MKLRDAISRWKAATPRARDEVIGFFVAEAENSEHDARLSDAERHWRYHPDHTAAESREDAR